MPEHGEPQINYCGEPGGRATPYGDSAVICTYHRLLSNHVLMCGKAVPGGNPGDGPVYCGHGGYCDQAPTPTAAVT